MIDIQTLYFLDFSILMYNWSTTFRKLHTAYAAVPNWEGLKNAPTVVDP